jgi:beta-galactosidase
MTDANRPTSPRPAIAAIEPLEPRRLLAVTLPESPRAELSLNGSWQFIGRNVRGAAAVNHDDSNWATVTVPHTWNAFDAQDGGANYHQGSTWYRRDLELSRTIAKRRVHLRFDAVGQSAELYVNGVFVGGHVGGYSSFTYDFTNVAVFGGNNVIAVKVNNETTPTLAPIEGDYNFYGGIYRDVSLFVTSRGYIDPSDYGSTGVYIDQKTATRSTGSWDVRTILRNRGPAKTFTVRTTILDAEGDLVASDTRTQPVGKNKRATVVQPFSLANPRLWNGKADPHLYTANVELIDPQGFRIDSIAERFGLRTFAVDPNQGFLLNGNAYPLYGAAIHQDWLDLGPAVTDAHREIDVQLLDELGVTAVRISHYQHDRYTLGRFDELGIVAYAEIPLTNGFADNDTFRKTTRDQLRELIRQQYNHASIAMWGVYNELADAAPERAFVRELAGIVAADDPVRLSTSASNQDAGGAAINWLTDAPGFNRYHGWYYGNAGDIADWVDSVRAGNRNRPIGVTEFGYGGSIYQHTDTPERPIPTRQPFHPEQYLNVAHEQAWAALKDRNWLWGRFIWKLQDSASDWRGEGDTEGRNDKGLVTYDRQVRKDAFYFYKAQWSDEPVLYLTSRRFTERPLANVEVKAYANTSDVTLVLNGRTIGRKTPSMGIAKWNVTLRTGANTIEIRGNRGGKSYVDTVTWTHTPPQTNGSSAGNARLAPPPPSASPTPPPPTLRPLDDSDDDTPAPSLFGDAPITP